METRDDLFINERSPVGWNVFKINMQSFHILFSAAGSIQIEVNFVSDGPLVYHVTISELSKSLTPLTSKI